MCCKDAEDIALARAIAEGLDSQPVSKQRVLDILLEAHGA